MAGEIAVVAVNSALVTTAALESPLMSDSRDASTASHPAAQAGTGEADTTETQAPALWKDYLLLTKPRVISLLLFTTLTAMFIAADAEHPVTIGLFLATALGFYMAAGSAHTVNMIIDRDIDGRMPRTANRALVAGRISVRNASIFAALLGVGSMAILWWWAQPMAALMALSGLLFYVIVYTMILKRRTWHNIVIGGAAGSFPPLVGWAAVQGDLNALAWILFAIIFAWTPVHFWALAILIKDDYALAKVPMLPVLRGERATAVQIGLYAIVTVVVTFVPLAMREVGWLYVVSAVALNAVLLWKSYQLLREPVRPRASWLFHYSMLYLALLFLAMAIDRATAI